MRPDHVIKVRGLLTGSQAVPAAVLLVDDPHRQLVDRVEIAEDDGPSDTRGPTVR